LAQQQYLLQQQALQQAQKTGQQSQDQPQAGPKAPVQTPQTNQQPAGQQTATPPAPHWSYRNISERDKIGLAGLGVVLIALAFAAGIVPKPRIRH
jgi:hypothetical protein